VIKRHARQSSLPHTTCGHTFRATGITTYLQNGGTIVLLGIVPHSDWGSFSGVLRSSAELLRALTIAEI
jgi:hypothetical protein